MEWTRLLYKWLNYIQSGIYPPTCILCGDNTLSGRLLCEGCLREMPGNGPYCRRCGIPLTGSSDLCGQCGRKPPPVERSVIPFRYAPPLDYLIRQMKFHRRLELLPQLAQLMAESIVEREESLPRLLIPVPMHRKRIRQRGYNQALELARQLSRELGIPLDWKRCRRSRHTSSQTVLQGHERRANVRGAFTVRGKLPKHVAIVDDVVTTGATVQEFARTLRRAGVEVVEVWACARAGEDR